MEQIFYGVLLMSAAGSAVFALFKMVTALLGKKLSPKWCYHALKACALLFVLPLSLFGKLMQKAAVPNTAPNTAPVFALAQNDTVQAAAQEVGHNVFLSFAGVWAFGVLLVVLWQAFCFIKLRLSTAKYAVKASAQLQAAAQECAETLGIRQKPMLFISKNAASPVLIGLFTPIILLPSEVLPKEGTDFMLKHELTHFKRKDLWLKIAFVLVKAVHWFNPLVFIACRELNLWCEYSCDAAVADGLCHEEKKQYAMAIILAAANVGRAGIGFGVPFISAKKKIERRLDFIFSSDNYKDKKALNRAAAAFMVTAMLTASALTACANPRAAEPTEPIAVSSAPSIVQKKVSPPKEPLIKEKPDYKSVAVPMTVEDSKQLVADGILPKINTVCARCPDGTYIVNTETLYTDTYSSTCIHYSHGDDITVTTYYKTNVDCPVCGHNYSQNTDKTKVTCHGFS